MNKQIILTLLLCMAMFGLARGGPSSETSQTVLQSGEQLKWQVITSSGGSASGGGFKLTSSLGQTAAGKSTSSSFHLIHGFLQTFGTTVTPCTSCGDADGNGGIDISDAVYLIAFIFSGGLPPGACGTPTGLGDADGSGSVDISDAVYLISYIFNGGPTPHCP
jgi:hypothetical protein